MSDIYLLVIAALRAENARLRSALERDIAEVVSDGRVPWRWLRVCGVGARLATQETADEINRAYRELVAGPALAGKEEVDG